MTEDEKYMSRCLQLALNGKGRVAPNPMVGAVVVHNGLIIGEGYHRLYGKPHAEVNAIASVKDKELLKSSVLYVSLEPCSHYGKTPPCAQLIIDSKIPKVVIACKDPYPDVSGRGIEMLHRAGTDVTVGILEKEALALNKEFFTVQTAHRPYIYLKWAQTSDGFIDKCRDSKELPAPTPISDDYTQMLVHKKRSEIASIMIATNTAVKDNPSLTTRLWYGKSPVRIVLDRTGRIPLNYKIYDNSVKTLIYTEFGSTVSIGENIEIVNISFNKNSLHEIFSDLATRKINSVLVEGGQSLLQNLINTNLWDEAYIEISPYNFGMGVKAPVITGNVIEEHFIRNSKHLHLKRLYL